MLGRSWLSLLWGFYCRLFGKRGLTLCCGRVGRTNKVPNARHKPDQNHKLEEEEEEGVDRLVLQAGVGRRRLDP